jgi:uncharacterized protein (DUF849 family)
MADLQRPCTRAVPVSASELAADAPSVRAAGAAELHIHVRDHEGAETLDPNAVASCLTAIRDAVPGMPVGIGTGAWITPGGRTRHRDIRAWAVAPDYCSVNLNEEDAVEAIARLDAASASRPAFGIDAMQRVLSCSLTR